MTRRSLPARRAVPPIRIAAALAVSLVIPALCVAARAGSGPVAAASPHAVLMSFTYGSGPDQIDTSVVHADDPFRAAIAAYRVEPDGTAWLLAGRPGAQTLRRFRPVSGLARMIQSFPLPADSGSYADFIFVPGGIILSRTVSDPVNLAAFDRFEPGSGVIEKAFLPRSIGYNRVRGRQIANIGRLRVVADTLYNCFDRTGSCVRIGTPGHVRTPTTADVMSGAPTVDGEPLWSDHLRVFCGISPIVDLSADGPGVIEQAFEDGSFVIQRLNDVRTPGNGILERFELYNAEGRLLRSLMIPPPPSDALGVGDASELYFSTPWIYRLTFGSRTADLERY